MSNEQQDPSVHAVQQAIGLKETGAAGNWTLEK